MGHMESAREARLAAAKARRSTPEFAAAGSALVAERNAAAMNRRAEHERSVAESWEREQANVSPAALDRHVRAFERLMADVDADFGAGTSETAALELLDGYLLTNVPVSRRGCAIALELLRTTFGMSTAEGIEHLTRIAGAR